MIPFTGKTRLHFLIGSPITQVLAPGRMTERMRAHGEDAILVPLEVGVAQLAPTVAALKAAPNVDGILVTLPHKVAMVRFADRLSRRAAVLQAVNVLRRTPAGWEGDNFDGAGMSHAISRAGGTVRGARIHMVGAGAAATSIAEALLAAGAARLSFNDLVPASEQRLLARLGSIHGDRLAIAPVEAAAEAEMIINASHCGLHAADLLPVPEACLHGQFVADVITDPLDTPLLGAARRAGGRTVTGGDMLDGQLQLLHAFIGGAAPLET